MYRWKTILVFVLAIGISAVAASYRFGDSAHAIGMLSAKGGKARHPFMIKSGKKRYTLVMTGGVLPPYQGDVRVALEGSAAMNYSIYDSEPILNLGIHQRPKLEGDTLYGVESGNKLALWVVMIPVLDEDPEALFDEKSEILVSPTSHVGQPGDADQSGQQPLKLGFYAADTGQTLLQIPVVFADLQPEGGARGSHH